MLGEDLSLFEDGLGGFLLLVGRVAVFVQDAFDDDPVDFCRPTPMAQVRKVRKLASVPRQTWDAPQRLPIPSG